MARTVIQKLRDVFFGSAYNGFKAIKSNVQAPAVADVADAVGFALVSGVANVDNAIIRADGTGGKCQKSLVLIDDHGSIVLPEGQTFSIGGQAVNEVTKVAVPKTGIVAPTLVVPDYVGQTYIDTVAGNVYVANHTDAGDWLIIPKATVTPSNSTGTAAPETTPDKVGDIFIDTAAKKLYFSVGVAADTDWIIAH